MNDVKENQKNTDAEANFPMGVADEEIQAMLKAGVHLGRISPRTSPKMLPYIYTNRNGMAVFDLVKTKEKIAEAETFIKKILSERKNILYVGTKPQARKFIHAIAEKFSAPNITDRWIGGTLTNSKVILGRVQKLLELEREKAEGGFKKYTKKEAMLKDEEIQRLEATFGGLRNLKKIPDALFLADTDEDELAIREANRMNIPVVAIVNSNSNPNLVQYPIPANDTSLLALEYIFNRISKAIEEGRKEIKPVE